MKFYDTACFTLGFILGSLFGMVIGLWTMAFLFNGGG